MSRFITQAFSNKPITIYGDGKQTRSFCYITDTVRGLLLLITGKNVKEKVVNVGNSQELTILELARKIKEITKSSSMLEFYPLPKDDPKRRCPNTTRLEKLVGWKPQVTLEEGLDRAIRWFSSKTL